MYTGVDELLYAAWNAQPYICKNTKPVEIIVRKIEHAPPKTVPNPAFCLYFSFAYVPNSSFSVIHYFMPLSSSLDIFL